MDIICKCGHDVTQHEEMAGCFQCAIDPDNLDGCVLTRDQVYKIHIAEQQARLDTNRQQVAYLMKEQEYLWNVFVELRGAFHRIIGNVNNSEIVLEICDKVLRIIDNEK